MAGEESPLTTTLKRKPVAKKAVKKAPAAKKKTRVPYRVENTDWYRRLQMAGACWESLEWIRARNFKSLQAAWNACERLGWMRWLVADNYKWYNNKTVSPAEFRHYKKQYAWEFSNVSSITVRHAILNYADSVERVRKIAPKVPRLSD